MARARPSPRTPLHEQRVRAWWATLLAVAMSLLLEALYIFLDVRVHPGRLWLPLLRAAHAAECLVLLGALLARRREASTRSSSGVFSAAMLPYLYVFAEAEVAMAASGLTWLPMTGPKLAVLVVGLLAPGRLWVGLGLIGAFCLEAVVLWYGLGLEGRLDMPWEPWVTLVYGLTGCAMLGWRVRAWLVEQRLWQARAEAESLQQLARSFLAVRDAANTPLQTLELGTAMLRRRLPEGSPVLDTMERALQRLRALTQRMSRADALLEWRRGEESFDADAVLRALEQSLERELERRKR